MELVRFQNSVGQSLAGIYYPFDSPTVVVIAHGFTSTKDRPHYIHLAETLHAMGNAVLRFDFVECGQSDRGQIGVAGQTDDLHSAIAFMRTKGYSVFGLLGESLGGLVALRAYSPHVKTMVLWAPVTDKRLSGWQKNQTAFQIRDGVLVFHRDGRDYCIADDYAMEREQIDQAQLLAPIRCPVLIVHGDRDDVVPLEWSQNAVRLLPNGSRLQIVSGAGHTLRLHAEEIVAQTAKWFDEHLKN